MVATNGTVAPLEKELIIVVHNYTDAIIPGVEAEPTGGMLGVN
jgi:hypothetical protein